MTRDSKNNDQSHTIPIDVSTNQDEAPFSSKMHSTPKLIGVSKATQNIRKLVELVAPSDATVMILGESGTGKELIAHHLHELSSRKTKPFVPVNCGAIPGELLESELFGHEKGAFTGALSMRKGRFETAHHGTLFLDEIGDMPLAMQVKLLRVIEERTFERVGSNKSIHVDLRIIAATHRNLEEAITIGDFREDLYYRLNVFPIEIPPLRHRVEDIPLLINELISRFETELKTTITLESTTIDVLKQYPWPGNVRQLANLIERLMILYPQGHVKVADLPEKFRETNNDIDLDESDSDSLETVGEIEQLKKYFKTEKELLKQVLTRTKGDLKEASKLLQVSEKEIIKKIRKYELIIETE